MADLEVKLTDTERRHLLSLMEENAEEGSYYGNQAQYWARHWRIVEKLDPGASTNQQREGSQT